LTTTDYEKGSFVSTSQSLIDMYY